MPKGGSSSATLVLIGSVGILIGIALGFLAVHYDVTGGDQASPQWDDAALEARVRVLVQAELAAATPPPTPPVDTSYTVSIDDTKVEPTQTTPKEQDAVKIETIPPVADPVEPPKEEPPKPASEPEEEAPKTKTKTKEVPNYYDSSKPTTRAKEKKLLAAAAAGKPKRVRAALQDGANPNCKGMAQLDYLPPLHLAARGGGKGHYQVVHLLVAAGARADRAQENVQKQGAFAPALFYAVGFKNMLGTHSHKVARVLLEKGDAKVNRRSKLPVVRLMYHAENAWTRRLGSWSPLQWATLMNNDKGVEVLLKHGAKVNQATNGVFAGLTPLHLTAIGAGEFGNEKVVQALLRHGADPSAIDEEGRTVLHHAAIRAADRVAEIVLAASEQADELLAAEDTAGRTPMDYARLPPVFHKVEAVFLRHASPGVTALFKSVETERLADPEATKARWEASPRGGWNWGPTKLDSDRCDIESRRFDEITFDEFMSDFYQLGRPLILTGNMTSSWRAWTRWTREGFVKRYGDMELTTGPVPYGSLYNRAQQQVRAGKFIEEMAAGEASVLSSQPADETSEPWIIFDRDIGKHRPAFMRDFEDPEWFGHYGTLEAQISIGSYGSGAPWHHHVNAYNVVLHGRKKWFLAPPAQQPALHSDDTRDPTTQMFSSGVQPLTWYYERYLAALERGAEIVECTQGPGDVIFVPRLWAHMTINLSETICMAREFFNEDKFEVNMIPYVGYRAASGQEVPAQ